MEPKMTALYNIHKNAGAKLVDFAGYWMPIQYSGIMSEHRKVRKSVGLFDVSHMGEFKISGAHALDFLQQVTINNVSKLAINQVQYSALCYESGGIVDDLLVYRLEDYYITVVNASNLEKDFNWMKAHLIDGAQIANVSDRYTLLAVQGPDSLNTLKKILSVDISNLPFYWLTQGQIAGIDALISRTGYTGELGYEIGFAPEHSEKVWNAIMDAGQEFEIEPIGLAARDTLRLEMKYCLYGNDIDQTTNPLEAGLGWITKLKKGDFIGREAILKAKKEGIKRKLVGLVLAGRGIPRHGYSVFKDAEKIGEVTSGTMSPMLNKGIAMAYLAKTHTAVGTNLDIEIRNKLVPAQVVSTPFYEK